MSAAAIIVVCFIILILGWRAVAGAMLLGCGALLFVTIAVITGALIL